MKVTFKYQDTLTGINIVFQSAMLHSFEKVEFHITPKGQSGSVPLKQLKGTSNHVLKLTLKPTLIRIADLGLGFNYLS